MQTEITAYNQAILQPYIQQLLFIEISDEIKNKIFEEIKTFKEENKDAEKWFSENAITGLAIIKCLLFKRQNSEIREFFELAFFAVIRRVSNAYDGEVRPHVNKNKKERNVADAYSKKVVEMLDLMDKWNHITRTNVISEARLCDNASAWNISNYIIEFKNKMKKQLGLVVSHPPYLNCFDYIPVFKLKFMWSTGFDNIFYGYDYKQIKKMEIKSYPANSTENIEKYFKHNEIVYKIVFDNLRPGGYCCIVIGDCTLKETLFEVHKTFISMLEKTGFITEKIAYRSTFYGTGQYAYKYRAGYNENKNTKKDGVLFFRKP